MRLPTASYLPIAMNCAASCILPRVERDSPDAWKGRVRHRFFHTARKAGREIALAQIEDEELRAECAAIDLTELPKSGEPELSVAWDYRTDTARIIGTARDYSKATPFEYCGTADLVDEFLDQVTVDDAKTGFHFVAPTSWQMNFLSLAFARAKNKDSAEAAIIRFGDGGVRRFPVQHDAMALDGFAVEFVRLAGRIEAAEEQYLATGTVDVRPGEHCRYCKCVEACPAHTALIRAMPGVFGPVAENMVMLSDETVALAYEKLVQAETLLKRVRAGIETIAATHPIPLRDGKVLKEVEKPRESINPEIATRVLFERYGVDGIKGAETKCTKASLKRAGYASALEAIREAGGITETRTARVEEVEG